MFVARNGFFLSKRVSGSTFDLDKIQNIRESSSASEEEETLDLRKVVVSTHVEPTHDLLRVENDELRSNKEESCVYKRIVGV